MSSVNSTEEELTSLRDEGWGESQPEEGPDVVPEVFVLNWKLQLTLRLILLIIFNLLHELILVEELAPGEGWGVCRLPAEGTTI